MSTIYYTIPALRPARLLFFHMMHHGSVTQDDLNEMHEMFGWSIASLKRKARKMGITIEPGEAHQGASGTKADSVNGATGRPLVFDYLSSPAPVDPARVGQLVQQS